VPLKDTAARDLFVSRRTHGVRTSVVVSTIAALIQPSLCLFHLTLYGRYRLTVVVQSSDWEPTQPRDRRDCMVSPVT